MPERKKGVVPRLRFPEFRNTGPWEEKRLGEICDVLQGYGFPEKFQGKKNGKYPFCKVSDITYAVNKTGGAIARAENYVDDEDIEALRARLVPIGATVFAKIGEALRLNKRALVSVECLIDNNVVGLRGRDNQTKDRFVFYLSQKIDLNEYCGGAVPAVNKSTLESIKLFVPEIEEQQKIADCLSSLDEVIELEVQKLEALKAHKKGLMQQLFPREGETTPRLRFPEFRDAGPWEVKRLSNTLHRISNGLTIAQVSGSCGVKVTRIETISTGRIDPNKVGYVNTDQDITQYRLRIGDILFSHINSLTHIGKSAYVDKDYNLYHGMNLLRLSVDAESNDSRFVFYLINTSIFQFSVRARANQAINQASINQTELGQSCVLIPTKKEQQKIADCLSSLDEVIELEAQKLDVLKTHKKGLMQQLFPQEVD